MFRVTFTINGIMPPFVFPCHSLEAGKQILESIADFDLGLAFLDSMTSIEKKAIKQLSRYKQENKIQETIISNGTVDQSDGMDWWIVSDGEGIGEMPAFDNHSIKAFLNIHKPMGARYVCDYDRFLDLSNEFGHIINPPNIYPVWGWEVHRPSHLDGGLTGTEADYSVFAWVEPSE